MKTATVRQIQHNLSEVLAWVAEGETVTVTKHKETVARIIPIKRRAKKPSWPDFAARLNKSAEALDVSFVQMNRYLTASDYAKRQAMSAAFERLAKTARKIYARDMITGYQPRENGTLPDRLAFPVLDLHAQPEVSAKKPN